MYYYPFGEGTRNARLAVEHGTIDEKRFLELQIQHWKRSPERRMMITGDSYYDGDQDILKRKRTIIGEDGKIEEVGNLPNNRVVDNQYAIAADKKVNYLVGKPLTFDTDAAYQEALQEVLGKRFHRMLRTVTYDSLNCSRGWVYPYYNDAGELAFQRFPPWEVLAFWRDADETVLDIAVHVYKIEDWDEREEPIEREFVEVYKTDGVYFYELKNGYLEADTVRPFANYITYGAEGQEMQTYQWDRIPLVSFKCGPKGQSLIKRVKGLQDAINVITSDFMNNMQEDARNTILVLVNYDGTNLGEFRRNLAQYGAVKVRSDSGAGGDVRTLQVEVNSENYQNILKVLKDALIENARSFDAKDDRLTGSPNQMNIQSMYADIDLDANGMETEYQASLEELLWFVNMHLANTGKGDFAGQTVNIIFNRDMLINETEAITNCRDSEGILSHETIVGQHPWVSDVQKELRRIEKERQSAQSEYESYSTGLSTAREALSNGKQTEQEVLA